MHELVVVRKDAREAVDQISPGRDPAAFHITHVVQKVNQRPDDLFSAPDSRVVLLDPSEELAHSSGIMILSRIIGHSVHVET